MSGLPPLSISGLRVVRTCPEHRCRILRRERLWSKCRSGKLTPYVHKTKKKNPTPDYRGRPSEWNWETFLHDHTYPKGHERFIVLRAHSYRLADESAAGSGLLDPKEITIGDVNYRQLDPANPVCELCEGGDMIPSEERFYRADYNPQTKRQSPLRKLFGKLRKGFYKLYDRWDQRGF